MDAISPENILLFLEKPETTLQAKKSNLACDLADETVILNIESGIYYGLNNVGTYIWKLLQEPRTFAQIKNQILADYDVDSEKCQQEVMQLLADLIAKGLVDINAPGV
jgi:hypothetical protein